MGAVLEHRRRLGSLGWRLLGTFVAVAVGAVGLLAVIAATSVDRGTSHLLASQRAQLRTQIAAALAAAYRSGRGSWDPASLSGLQALATATGTGVEVTDHSGHQVAAVQPAGDHGQDRHDHAGIRSPGTGSNPTGMSTGDRHSSEPGPAVHDMSDPGETGHAGGHAPAQAPAAIATSPAAATTTSATTRATTTTSATTTSAGAAPAAGASSATDVVPIVVDGQQVGTARLTLPDSTTTAVGQARRSLLGSVAAGAVLAALLAGAAAVVVSRRLSRPLVALAGAARRLAAGDPDPGRLVRTDAPGELGEVGRAFTAMADTLQREEALRRAVVADVAHELRTPVTILRGQTEQLLDGIAEPTPARLVSLHDEVLRLERLTDDLATLSAADAAGLALHAVPTDLGELTGQALQAMTARLADADLILDADLDAGVIVDADPDRLTQVITNLLGNAAKFTPTGGRVTVGVHHRQGRAELSVADTGPGIPAEDLPHVFERFWRGRDAAARSGSGIGLAVVQALVSAHHGDVAAASPPGAGTTITITLPPAGPDGAATRGQRIRPREAR